MMNHLVLGGNNKLEKLEANSAALEAENSFSSINRTFNEAANNENSSADSESGCSSDNKFTIAFYDSGLGGFSVVKECVALYPDANIIYMADTAYCPLGIQPKPVIKERVELALKRFSEMGADYSIIACNTASIHGLSSDIESQNVLGTVTAMCREARMQLDGIEAPKVLILGTTQTIKSNVYTDRLQALFPDGYIEGLATDPFVTLVEGSAEGGDNGEVNSSNRISVVAEVLKGRKLEAYDAVVMGCTHFPFLQNEIKMVLGEEIKVINPALQIAKSLKIGATENNLKQVSVISTGYTPNYDAVPFVSTYLRSINQTV